METLTIEATTRETALRLCDALSAFQVELAETDDGRCRVEVQLRRGDREFVDVLNTIEQHVIDRHSGSARIKLNGRSYTMHAPPDEQGDPLLGDL